MKKSSRAGLILKAVMLMLLSAGLTACFQTDRVIVLPDSRVQKMSKGESANFDGYLLTTGAAAKLLETAERCRVVK